MANIGELTLKTHARPPICCSMGRRGDNAGMEFAKNLRHLNEDLRPSREP